jgi:hypothetical protein
VKQNNLIKMKTSKTYYLFCAFCVFATTISAKHLTEPANVEVTDFNDETNTRQQRSGGLRRAQTNEIFYEDVPDMKDAEIKSVMDWIAAETTMVKNPFCWKDSYGRGVGTLPGRVADCPSGYTNDGLTCRRPTDDILAPSKVADCPSGYTNMGYTCFRGLHTYHAPSRVADCPSGYTNMGLTCHKWWPPKSLGWGSFRCPSGYFKSDITHRCHKNCKAGYKNDGEFCSRHAHSLGMSSMKCPDGYFQSKITARCHKECPSGYTNTGETCHRPLIVKGLDSMSCKPGERSYMSGARCFPQSGQCFGNGDLDAGLCYPKCRPYFDGVGPVCWGLCDNSMVNCGLSCAKSTEDCVLAVADQIIAPLIVAANVATLGLATPATATASATLRVGGKTVAGSSKIGKALVWAVKNLQTVKPGGLKTGATVIQRIVSARTGKTLSQVFTTSKVTGVSYKAMKQFRQTFAEDFAEQTSTDIESELDSHFIPTTAKYLKGLWGERMIAELAEANNWQIASTALAAASVVDITGVTGVVSAYAKPECNKIVPFPCTHADKKNCKGINYPVASPTTSPTTAPGQSFMNDFDFYPYMDSGGNDIGNFSGGVQVYAEKCSKDPKCKGFNSNGWMKHTVMNQSQWSKWTSDPSLGFYVKKVDIVVDYKDKFNFYPYMDSGGNDIGNFSGGVQVYAEKCFKDPKCKGFNSNGWMKHTVMSQSQWSKWTSDPSLGFYVKK